MKVRAGLEVGAGIETDRASGLGPAGASGTLLRGSLAHLRYRERGQPRPGRVAREADEAAVHHDSNSGDGDARFGDVGREDDLTSLCGREGPVLLLRGEIPVERHHEKPARLGEIGKLLRGGADLARARQEDEDVA